TDRPTEPLPVRLFRLRLEKQALLHRRDPNDERVTRMLQTMLSQLPLDNINVRPHREEITNLTKRWPLPLVDSERHLTHTIAPLLRYAWTASLPELQFRVTCERLAVAWLVGKDEDMRELAQAVREAVANLADNIDEVKTVAEQRAWMMSDGFWEHLDLDRLDMLQD